LSIVEHPLLSTLNCGIPLSDDGPSRFHDSALVSLGVFPVQRLKAAEKLAWIVKPSKKASWGGH